MSEAAAKTAGKAQSSSVERRPQRPAVGPERASAVDAMRVLHGRAGNRAMTQAIGGGLPLPAHICREMESRFGAEFGDVRVHDDASAHAGAAALNAKAYTHGVHIVFSRDTFAPERREGRQLLAHELAHVVQQRRGGAAQPRQDGRGALETDARRAADAVVNGSGAVAVAGASAPGVASEPEDDDKRRKRKSKKPTADTLKPDRKINDPVDLRGKHTLEEFSERAHDPDIRTELEGERTRVRSGGSERARHADRLQDIDEHHGFPKFLGGNRVQTYIKLTKDLHYLYHEELYLLLEKELKARGVLPKDAGWHARRGYGRLFARLSPADRQAILDKVVAHAEKFDARYRKTEYPDKRQKLATALRRGIREAKAEAKNRAKAAAGKKPAAASGAPKPTRKAAAGSGTTATAKPSRQPNTKSGSKGAAGATRAGSPKSVTPKSATPKSATPKSATPKSATPKPPARSGKGSQVAGTPAQTTPRAARPRKPATAKPKPAAGVASGNTPPAAAKPAGNAAKPAAPPLKPAGRAAKPPGKPIPAATPSVPTAPKSTAPKSARSSTPKPPDTPKRSAAGRPVAPAGKPARPNAPAATKPRTAPKPGISGARLTAPRPPGIAGAPAGGRQVKGGSAPVRPPAKPATPSAPTKPSVGAPPGPGAGKITDREISRQLIAGRGKFGVGGGVSIAQQQQHANGVTTTHAAAFGGKAWVETTEDLGSNPKQYRVTFHVNLSAQASAEAKHERGVSGSVSAGGSLELTKSRLLPADEKQRYLDAVNSGVSAGYQELRVAELAAQGSLEEAKALLMEIKGAVGKPDVLAGMQEGDDVTIEASGVIGGELGLSRGPVSVHGGVSKSGTLIFSKSLRGGRIIISVTSAEGTEKKGGGGINVSGIGMDVTKSADNHSSESYTFVLDSTDPERNARYGRILAARSMGDLAALRAADHGLLSWHSTSAGKGEGDKTAVTAGSDDANVALNLGGHHDVTQQTIEGPDGKTTIWTGTRDGGGSIAFGRKTVVSGDRTDEFTGGAGPDNKGFGEVSTTKRDSHAFVALKKLFSGDKPVGTAAGVATGDEETATATNKEGAALTDDSYARLDAIARAGLKAWASHWNGNLATREAWIKAWPKVIAANGDRQLIAKAMSEFQDAATRGGAETVRNAIEGTAIAFEFPEGLLPMKPLYDSLVVQDPILEAEAESNDAAALSKLNDALSRLSAMSETLNQHAGDFQRPADYIEMRQRIDARAAAVRAEIARRSAPAKNPAVPAGAGKDKSPPQQKSADGTAAKPEVRSDAGQDSAADSGKEQAANDPAVVQTKIAATVGRLNSYRVIEQKTFAEMEEELNSFFGPSVIDMINIERKLKEAYPKWDNDIVSLRELYKQAGDTDDVAASKTVPFKPNRQRYLDLDSRVPYRGMGSGLPGYKEI